MFNQNQPKPTSIFKDFLIFMWEIFKVVVISLAIIIPVRYFLIQPFYVKGASMEPNFEDHQYLIIDELTYRFKHPERGQVVVFRYPLNPREYFIKRVIGLPGEKLEIQGEKIIVYNENYPNGLELNESYLSPEAKNTGQLSVELAADEYYLMGDNRTESLDSRFFGPVQRKYLIGKVIFRGWPLDKVGLFLEPPDYSQ